MRVAELDMTKQKSPCSVPVFTERPLFQANAHVESHLILLVVLQFENSEVCGIISDRIYGCLPHSNPTINDYYVDGVSLTHGNPRQHIWTFTSALHEVVW